MTTSLNGSTPLTRHGSRVPATPSRTGTNTLPTTATPTPAPATAAPVQRPLPTIRTMIVCVPDQVPRDALISGRLDEHLNVRGTLTPRFWASPNRRPWHRNHYFGLQPGRPASCAGGPIRLLDLAGMRHAAAIAAGIRHHLFTQVVHGTRPATAWTAFLHRHHTQPDRYPLATAEADFHRQPRVLAIRMHNAAYPGPAHHLDLAELEMYQAGPAAYQHYIATTAICADALLTADSILLAPASDTATDRITYLDRAHHHLINLPAGQRLVAVTV